MKTPSKVCSLVCAGLMTLLACTAQAQSAAVDSMSAANRNASLYPEYRRGRDLALLGAGAATVLTGLLIQVDVRDVPVGGLDPSEISWAVDRNIVGNANIDADHLSDWTRTAAIVLPFALALATEESGQRWHGLARRSGVYAQTFLFSQGVTAIAKTTIGRARPYAYLPAAQRPAETGYDVTQDRTFYSMPSGHSSSAWTGASLAMTEHLLTRPRASWPERVGVGFLGGTLAGMTSALRVTAGQHFPSDVLLGGGIGAASAVILPLLHRGESPMPMGRHWLQMGGGALAGTLLGMLLAQSL